MDEVGTNAGTLRLLGGRLSLDFANTADWHASDHPVEFLKSYSDLVAWSQHVGLLTDHQAQRLLKEAARHPGDATAVLERAIALREAIYRIFSAISHGRPPPAADFATFNAELSRALTQSRIVSTAQGFTWDWAGAEDALDQMLWPVVHDAAGLLTSEELDRVGRSVWLALPRHEPEPQPPMVLHGGLWQPCQGPPTLRAETCRQERYLCKVVLLC
jgi:predicted RNA-binding Zn ribbon-like protein